MQHSWLRSFAGDHRAMLCWLACVAVTAIMVTTVLSSRDPGAIYALLAIPLLLMTGFAAGLAETVLAIRRHRGELRSIIAAIIGTGAIGLVSLPMTAALAFMTIQLDDMGTMARAFPAYQQVVVDIHRGVIIPSGTWQSRGSVRFMADPGRALRVAFSPSATGFARDSIVYDASGEVATRASTPDAFGDPQHRIGHLVLNGCRPTPITAYYRCARWSDYEEGLPDLGADPVDGRIDR
jgi:hypothetical protein